MKERVFREPDISFLQLREHTMRWTDLSESKAVINRTDSQLIVMDRGAVINSDAVLGSIQV